MTTYDQLIEKKLPHTECRGFEPVRAINSKLFDWQQKLVEWALRLGRAALFCDCGLGKGPMQLEWAAQVMEKTGKPFLGLCPLCVADQLVSEGEKFGYRVKKCREPEDFDPAMINYTNYERLAKFEHLIPSLGGVALDESSILKNVAGVTSQHLCEVFAFTPYRLCCTATPAPNDYEEMGMHAEFLGYGSRRDMLTTYFVHDSANTSEWRLKKHAVKDFWRWVATWAACVSKPSDLGYPDGDFILPPLEIRTVQVEVDATTDTAEGELFRTPNMSSTSMHKEMRLTCGHRAQAVAEIVNQHDGPVIIWCNTNYEADELFKWLPSSIEVRGNDDANTKELKIRSFTFQKNGTKLNLVSKASICGFGMNWQFCNHHVFMGLSYSFEQFYQAIRRGYRFGQKNPFTVTIVQAQTEAPVKNALLKKIKQHEAMREEMKLAAKYLSLNGTAKKAAFNTEVRETGGAGWTLYYGDAVRAAPLIESESVGFSIYSPPFAALYVYSDDPQDMGNCATEADFIEQYRFLIKEVFRVTKPGRLAAVHCADITAQLWKDGYIGMKDLSAMIIQAHTDCGWQWHSPRVTIWKDPVVEMQRTKALGLLYKQLRKDSCKSRVGNPDYLLVFRKPGVNAEPVRQTEETYPLEIWQQHASPVWMDVRQTNVLQREGAREASDERHICPLQLDIILRALKLWSNPGDLIYSPFAGIGSEGVCAIELGRKFIGSELKKTYFDLAVAYLNKAVAESQTLFNQNKNYEK